MVSNQKKIQKEIRNEADAEWRNGAGHSSIIRRVGGAMTKSAVPLYRIVAPTGECQFQCGLRY